MTLLQDALELTIQTALGKHMWKEVNVNCVLMDKDPLNASSKVTVLTPEQVRTFASKLGEDILYINYNIIHL